MVEIVQGTWSQLLVMMESVGRCIEYFKYVVWDVYIFSDYQAIKLEG